MLKKFITLGTFALGTIAGAASAAPMFLNFDGSQSGALIGDFYNGGTDSFGNRGINYGVTFNQGATVRIDYGKTYLTNVTSISVRDGFTGGLTFQYATQGGDPNNDSYDFRVNLDTHLDQSYSQVLGATYLTNCTKYAGGYCFFSGGFGRAYDATAREVTFTGQMINLADGFGNIALDTVTFGIVPVTGPNGNIPPNSYVGNDPLLSQVPEPTTTALFGLGLLAAFSAARRKKA